MRAIQVAEGPGFHCDEHDTLLRAGLRAGLGFPYECNSGSCGTCKVELLEGQVMSLRPEAPGLSDRDRAKNRVLACQARPATDCRIKVRLREENIPRHRPARFRATLQGYRDLTHDLREFTFAARDSPGFLPGQYALFYLPGIEAPRTYSMSNVDGGSGEWQFVVKRMPGGVGTAAMFDLPAGTAIEMDGPYGLAYLRTDSPRDIVLIGGGSGLAPVLSLARGAVREPALAGRKIHAFYGARTRRDLCGDAQIKALPGYGERLFFEAVLSEPQADSTEPWNGPTGFVHEHVRKFVGGRWNEFEYYFAGPPPMAQAVQQMLIEKRVPYPQVHFDSFY
jgi:toluene monooxygenase electron transfer component